MATLSEVQRWRREEAAVFEGWDFSYLKDRAFQDEPPWSYRDVAANLIRAARHPLDVDTGGGESLASLAPLPPATKAIESYHPNVSLASSRLAAAGVEVSEVADGAPWPFSDASFDLILNRHGHLNVGETSRTLRAGGTFFTQQVASGNLADLSAAFGNTEAPSDNTLEATVAVLRGFGFEIIKGEEWSGHQSFHDVGALVYFLRAVPWVVRGFSVDSHLAILEPLDHKLRRDGVLTFSISRFMIEARKLT